MNFQFLEYEGAEIEGQVLPTGEQSARFPPTSGNTKPKVATAETVIMANITSIIFKLFSIIFPFV